MNALTALFAAPGRFLPRRVAAKPARSTYGQLVLTEAALEEMRTVERGHDWSAMRADAAPGHIANSSWWADGATANREEAADNRCRALAEHGPLFEAMLAVLARHDPLRIASLPDGLWEYAPELRTLLPLLAPCQSAAEVRIVIYGEFLRWFDSSAGDEADYVEIASEIWALWQEHRAAGAESSSEASMSAMSTNAVMGKRGGSE